MNRLKSSILVVFLAVASVTIVGFNAAPVEAQSSAALSIAPRKDYNIEPGKEINDTLLIRNLDRENPLNLSLRVIDFTSDGLGGTPKLLLDENEPPTEHSLRSILEVPRNVTIEPGENKSIDIKLVIPDNNGPGSYYSAIVYSSAPADGGNVGLSASGVTLVFAEQPGEVYEKLVLEKLGAYDATAVKDGQPSTGYKFFNVNAPKRIGYTIRNEGNVTGKPVGSITLKNIFGQEKVINDVNPNKSLALIDQTRLFDTCILLAKEVVNFDGDRQEANTCADAGLWPGFYSVDFQGFYGRNGNNTQELLGKAYFIYAPLWFIVVFLIVLAIVSYHVWKIVRFIKGKKRGTSGRSHHGKR